MRRLLAAWLIVGWTGFADASDLRVVDASGVAPGSFPTIAGALAAAGEGDLLLIKSGIYEPVAVHGMSIALVADLGADVVIRRRVQVSGLTADQVVELRGIVVQAEYDFTFLTDGYERGLHAHDNDGIVWAEDCEFRGFMTGVLAERARVALLRCRSVGLDASVPILKVVVDGGDAMVGVDAEIAIDRSELLGGASHLSIAPTTPRGGAGAVFQGSEAQLVGSAVVGADGDDGGPIGFACAPGTHGGDGLVATQSSSVRSVLTSPYAGAGGAAYGACPAGDDGTPVSVDGSSEVVDVVSTSVRGVKIASPLRAGQMPTMEIAGEAGDMVFLFWGREPALERVNPSHSMLVEAEHIAFATSLVSPTVGLSSLLPGLPAGVSCDRLFVQSLHMTAAGKVMLGGATTLHVVNAP